MNPISVWGGRGRGRERRGGGESVGVGWGVEGLRPGQ